MWMGAVPFIFKIVIIRDAVNGLVPSSAQLLIEMEKQRLYASYKSQQM